VFLKVNWSWIGIRSSKGVRITGPSMKFRGHSHTPQRRCSDSYWSFGPVMNNLLLDIATCPTDIGNDCITVNMVLWVHLFSNKRGPSWSYCSWIYNYLCNQCLSPLMLWVQIPLRRGVLDTTLCDQVCQWLAKGRWFSPSTLVSSTNTTDDIPI